MMRQAAAVAATLLAAGCGAPAPPPVPAVTLSTQNMGANAVPIADFFRRTCLAAPADDREMAAAIAASGWRSRQEHAQDWEAPSIWNFDHGQLNWFHVRSVQACLMSFDSLVSPTPAALAAALRPFVQRPDLEERSGSRGEVEWSWLTDGNHRMVLKIETIPASPGRTFGAGRQPVSLSIAREPMSAAGAGRE